MSDPRQPIALTSAARRRAAIARAVVRVESPTPTPTVPSTFAPGPAVAGAQQAVRAPSPAPLVRSRQPSGRAWPVIAAAGGSLAFAVVAIVLSMRDGDSSDAGAAQEDTPPVAAAPRPSEADVRARTFTPRERQPPEETIVSSNVVRALRGASYDFASRPDDAVRRFTTAVQVLGEAWVGLEHAQRLASLELAVDFLLRSSTPSDRWTVDARAAAFAGVDALLERASLDPPGVLRGVWSAGLTTRLLREPSADASLLEAAAARAGALGAEVPTPADATFHRGAFAALTLAAEKLAKVENGNAPASRESWLAWDRALEAVGVADPVEVRRVALRAAEAVLEGLSARPTDAATRDRLASLLTRCDWSSAGEARAALLTWLSDSTRFSTREVASVTQWLASNASDSGIGVGDTLSSNASTYQRSDLRGRLSARWSGGQTLVSASVLDRWSREIAGALASPQPESHTDPALALRAAADWGRLSRAAALLWRGEADAARSVIDTPPGVAGSSSQRTPRLDALAPRAGDGAAALRLLSASQNAQERIDILRDLVGSGNELGPVDAEVVFEQAMFGTPSEVRRIAQRIVELRSDDPAVINAALESLPRAPRTAAMHAVYDALVSGSLPALDDPDWPRAARGALVARLLDVLTGGASLDPADTLAAEFAAIYTDRAGSARVDASPAVIASDTVQTLLAECRASGGIAVEERIAGLTRRFDARRALASGELQRFAVESANAAEALSLLTSLERPEHAHAIDSIVRGLRVSINDARTAADQLVASERASARLWAIRMGGAP